MEYKQINTEIKTRQLVYRGKAEHKVEHDYFLPDYYEDISRILRVGATAVVTRQSVSDGKIVLEGEVNICIVYAPEEKSTPTQIYAKTPFLKSMDIKGVKNSSSVEATASTEYINCNLISKKRIDISGAIYFDIQIYEDAVSPVPENFDGEHLMTKRSPVSLNSPPMTIKKHFMLKEAIDPGLIPNYERCVMYNATAQITESKVITGKIIAKGDVYFDLTYLNTNGEVVHRDLDFPISQIIDTKIIDSTVEHMMWAQVMYYQIKSDDFISEGSVIVEVGVEFTAVISGSYETTVVTDAYDTKYDVELESQSVSYTKLAYKLDEMVPVKFSIDTGSDSIGSVVDLSINSTNITCVSEEDRTYFKLDFKFSIIYIDETGELISVIKNETYNTEYMIDQGDVTCISLKALPLQLVTSSADGHIEVSFTVHIGAMIYTEESVQALMQIQPKESRAYGRDCSLVIYYPDDKEDIWDIAKRYGTAEETIMEHNGLESRYLAKGTMLIIPVCK